MIYISYLNKTGKKDVDLHKRNQSIQDGVVHHPIFNRHNG